MTAAPTFTEVVEYKLPPPAPDPPESRTSKTSVYLKHPLYGDVLQDQPPTPIEEKPFHEQVAMEKAFIAEREQAEAALNPQGPMDDWAPQPLKTKRKGIVRETLAINDSAMFQTIDLQVEPAITDGVPFQVVAASVAVLNLIIVGFEADLGCWECPINQRMAWYVLDNLFSIFFFFEMICRIFAHTPFYFILGDGSKGFGCLHWDWINIFDCLIVIGRVVDTWVLMPLNEEVKLLKIISCLRILHLVPLIKHMRLHRHFREPWIIVSLLTDTYKIIFWVLVVMFIFIWVMAIVITSIVGKSETDAYNYDFSVWTWHDYWGSVPRSMFSLFQVVTLDKWANCLVRPLLHRSSWMILFFAPFICLTTMGLVNVIIAVVVESTIASAAANEERMNKKMQKVHTQVMESLAVIFEEADTDKSGDLDMQELADMVQKPNVRDRLHLLDITHRDLNILFEMLDKEQKGSIPNDKFFRGCARLRGGAMACDLHRMSIDIGRYVQWTADLVGHNRNTNKRLGSLLYDIAGIDRDILKGTEDEQDPVLLARRERALRGEPTPLEEVDEERKSSKVSIPEAAVNKRQSMPRHSTLGFVADDIRVLHGHINAKGNRAPPPPPLPRHLQRRGTKDTNVTSTSNYSDFS